MARLVMKFGGTSVANIERIRNVARHVKREIEAGHEVAVVVSAMSGKTNELVGWCRETAVLHDAREYDAIVASGELVTSGLLAIALQDMGIPARSWQGWQLPISTDDAHGSARILDVNGTNIIERFAHGEVAVIAGFQGIHLPSGRVTTLGRGGSDTSAVAVAAGIKADRCDIYTDVDGVYTTDPRFASVELAMVHKVRTFVRSSFTDPNAPELMTAGDPPGTLICDEEEIVESEVVTGIAFARDEAQVSIRRVPDKPGIAASVFVPLADAHINVDMIVQNISAEGFTDITFTVPTADFERAKAALAVVKDDIGFETIEGATDVVKISVIGIGMRSHAGVAAKAFKALSERGINIRAISTSEIKISVLIDAAYTELAVRTLHSVYGLDA